MAEQTIINYLKSISNDQVSEVTKSFFKTNEGEYSYGDIFLGIRVGDIRKSIKKFKNTPLCEIENLLSSKYHEVRHFGLLFLVEKFLKGSEDEKEKIFNIYIQNTKHINNWDLVDCSAHYIVGGFLDGKSKDLLYRLASSSSMWERRIAIVSTFYYIKKDKFDYTIKVAQTLLNDNEDLIHKALGWMLREVGKRDEEKLKSFLNKHIKDMPRTTLRYAIERLTKEQRSYYLNL